MKSSLQGKEVKLKFFGGGGGMEIPDPVNIWFRQSVPATLDLRWRHCAFPGALPTKAAGELIPCTLSAFGYFEEGCPEYEFTNICWNPHQSLLEILGQCSLG